LALLAAALETCAEEKAFSRGLFSATTFDTEPALSLAALGFNLCPSFERHLG